MLTHKVSNNRFEWKENGAISFISYKKDNDVFVLYHSEVPVAHRGKGIGKKMVLATYNYLLSKEAKILPTCPFIKYTAERNNLISG